MEITLIQDDIDSGIRKNSRRCPFALAFRRAFPDADEISVWLYDVIVRTVTPSRNTPGRTRTSP